MQAGTIRSERRARRRGRRAENDLLEKKRRGGGVLVSRRGVVRSAKRVRAGGLSGRNKKDCAAAEWSEKEEKDRQVIN